MSRQLDRAQAIEYYRRKAFALEKSLAGLPFDITETTRNAIHEMRRHADELEQGSVPITIIVPDDDPDLP